MKQFGKRTVRIIDAVLIGMIVFCVGCGAIRGNEEEVSGETSIANAGAELPKIGSETISLTEESGISEETETTEAEQRVIALSKSNAELWLLAGGTLVATSDDAMKLEGISEDTVSLGDMDHVSLEAIAALEPDLLILFSTDPAQKALGEAAEAVGLSVYYTNIDNFADYENVMLELTKKTGRDDLYKTNVTDVAEEIERIVRDVPVDSEGGKYLLLHVSATKSKVEKDDYFACEIFDRLGLENIAADDSAFDELSIEQIVATDPDYIFVVPRGDEEKALSSFDELFTSQPAWAGLSAVQNGHYYLLSKDLFGLKPNENWADSYQEAYRVLYGE